MKNIKQMLCMCSFFGLATHVSKAIEPQNLECMLRLQATQSDCRIENYKKNSGHMGSAMDSGTKFYGILLFSDDFQ